MDDELVGDGHRAAVGLLERRLRSIQAGEQVPRVVLLEGESGVGKTRIVRELYARLQQAQPDPPYWPPLELAAPGASGARVDPMPSRKVLGPAVEEFAWRAGALPPYLWWAIACDQAASGPMYDVIPLFENAMKAHLVPLSLARAQQDGGWKRLAASMRHNFVEEFREATREGAVETAGKVLEAVGAPVPGLGWLVNQSVQGWSWARTWSEHRRFAREGALLAELNPVKTSPTDDMIDALRQVLAPGLPAVVVVEDLHLMGESLRELLDGLAGRDLPVLVVGTAWPESRFKEHYAAWLESATGRGWVERVRVAPPDENSLLTLVRRAAPQVDDDTARRVARRWPNPLALLLVLSLEKFRRRIDRTGTLQISDDDLRGFPGTLGGIYRARWEELPKDVQRALLLAAAGLGRDHNTGAPSNAFVAEIIVQAAIAAGLVGPSPEGADDTLDGRSLGAAMARAVDPVAWLLDISPQTQFREYDLIDVVLADVDDIFERNDVHVFRTAIVKILSDRLNVARGDRYLLDHDDAANVTAASWLHSLADEVSVATTEEQFAQTSALLCLAAIEACSDRPASALRLAIRANWEQLWAPEHPDTIFTRHCLLSYRIRLGERSGMMAELRKLLIDTLRIHGESSREAFYVRGSLADCRGENGDTTGALGEAEELLNEQLELFGPGDIDVLNSRGRIARWYSESGDTARAVIELDSLLLDHLQVLGAEHVNTLAVREHLAIARGRDGDPRAALTELGVLLADQVRLLGQAHALTLSTRRSISAWCLEAGDAVGALAAAEAELSDRARGQNEADPQLLAARTWVADLRGEAGDVAGALAELNAVLPVQRGATGCDHPDTLATSACIAHWRGHTDGPEAAIRDFAMVLAGRVRVLGGDHERTLRTRRQIADWRAKAGDPDMAVAEYESVLADQTRALGPDHPDTIETHRLLDDLRDSM